MLAFLVVIAATTTWTGSLGSENVKLVASCFPRKRSAGLHEGLFECLGPESGSWSYHRDDPNNRECVGEQCSETRNHLRVSWLGPPLTEYKLSFVIRYIDRAVDAAATLLSLGGGRTVSMAAREDSFFEVPNNLLDGREHRMSVEGNATDCLVTLDDVLVARIGGTGLSWGQASRMCGPIRSDPFGVLFGAHTIVTGRAIFSRVAAQVRDVMLFTSSVVFPHFEGLLGGYIEQVSDVKELPNGTSSFDRESLEDWSRIEGLWQGTLQMGGGPCGRGRDGILGICCADKPLEFNQTVEFFRRSASMPFAMRITVKPQAGGDLPHSSGAFFFVEAHTITYLINFVPDGLGHGGINISTTAVLDWAAPQQDVPSDISNHSSQFLAVCMHATFNGSELKLTSKQVFAFDYLESSTYFRPRSVCPVSRLADVSRCVPSSFLEAPDLLTVDPKRHFFAHVSLLEKAEETAGATDTETQQEPAQMLSSPAFIAIVSAGCFVLLCMLGLFVIWQRRNGCKGCTTLLVRPRAKSPDGFEEFPSTSYTGSGQSTQDQELRAIGKSSVKVDFEPSEVRPDWQSDHHSSEIFSSTPHQVAARGLDEHWLKQAGSLRFDERCAHGAFGDVWRGKLHGTTIVAIKKPTSRGPAEKAASRSQALQAELRLFRYVRHPNIVLFHGAVLADDGELQLVLEWVDGRNFDEYISHPEDDSKTLASLDENRTRLLLDAARGMHYLHQQSPAILHRDLKPSNVMVEESRQPPQAKITDFGLGILWQPGDDAKTWAGTRSFMAPEVSCHQAFGPPADVFSFGCVMLFSLTGKTLKPEKLQGARNLCQKMLAAEEGLQSHVAILQIAAECLHLDPELRPEFTLVCTKFEKINEVKALPVGSDDRAAL